MRSYEDLDTDLEGNDLNQGKYKFLTNVQKGANHPRDLCECLATIQTTLILSYHRFSIGEENKIGDFFINIKNR